MSFSKTLRTAVVLILTGATVLSPVSTLATEPVSAPVTIPIIIPALQAPEMVYPANGQTLDLEGAYMFKVKPVNGSTGYLFGLFQDGKMVYENYRDDKKLSLDGVFNVMEYNPFHNKFHAGEVKVVIRTYANNKWSDTREITINLKPRAVSSPIPVAPSNLTVSGAVNTNNIYDTLTLKWKDNSSNENGFSLQRSTTSNFTSNVLTTDVPANTTTFIDARTVVRGQAYFYRVSASSNANAGNSAWSNTASIVAPFPSTPKPTITPTASPSATPTIVPSSKPISTPVVINTNIFKNQSIIKYIVNIYNSIFRPIRK